MDIRPIKTDGDYSAAIEEIERLMEASPEPGTPEGDRLEVLSILVDAYEEENYPIPLPDPIEAIKYYMETRGLTTKDLQQCIGHRGRVSEILNRKRSLTLPMIWKLVSILGIPAEILVQPYDLEEIEAPVDVRVYEQALNGIRFVPPLPGTHFSLSPFEPDTQSKPSGTAFTDQLFYGLVDNNTHAGSNQEQVNLL